MEPIALKKQQREWRRYKRQQHVYLKIRKLYYVSIENKIYLSNLTVLSEKTVLLNSAQESIQTEAWGFLTFFLCLHNQKISITFYCHILNSTNV